MFVIRNRDELRKHLLNMKKYTEDMSNSTHSKIKKDQHFYKGVQHGLNVALDALDDWEKQNDQDQSHPEVCGNSQDSD